MSNIEEWRFAYIVPITLLAVMLGILLGSVWIGLLIFSVAVYHIVVYIKEQKEYKAQKKQLKELFERGGISVSVDTLSHISRETIYEPRLRGRHSHSLKEITVFYFNSGDSWRMPLRSRHYGWSKTYFVSSKGLLNISIPGNKFYFVYLQGHYEISYIYPCEYFVLGEDLKNNQVTEKE